MVTKTNNFIHKQLIKIINRINTSVNARVNKIWMKWKSKQVELSNYVLKKKFSYILSDICNFPYRDCTWRLSIILYSITAKKEEKKLFLWCKFVWIYWDHVFNFFSFIIYRKTCLAYNHFGSWNIYWLISYDFKWAKLN